MLIKHGFVVCSCAVCFFPPQLRVVRAFKSTLEDMEERRSVHSLHSLRSSRSHPKQLSDISYIDEDVKTPSPNDYPYDIHKTNNHSVRNHTPDGETAPLMIRRNSPTSITSPVNSSSSGASLTNNNRPNPTSPHGYHLLVEPTKIHETSI